jgi:predicted kinase
MRVVIMRGIPGSGKSTYTAKLGGAYVVSADHFFMEGGIYKFDATKLQEAHGACMRNFVKIITTPDWSRGYYPVVVVDNTNITVLEVAPYAALALAYGHEVEVVTVSADPYVAAARNSHGVPEPKVLDMHTRLQRETPHLLRRWNPRVI